MKLGFLLSVFGSVQVQGQEERVTATLSNGSPLTGKSLYPPTHSVGDSSDGPSFEGNLTYT